MSKKRFYSIRHKLTLAVGAFFILFILGFLVLNRLFLEDYYIYKLESEMNAYGQAMTANLSDGDEEEMLRLLRAAASDSGYRFEVIDGEAEIVVSSSQDFNGRGHVFLPRHLKDYLGEHLPDLGKDGSVYVVFRNPEGQQGVVMMTVSMPDGHYLVMTEQLDRIQGNVAIANQFFLIVGIGLTAIWVLVTFFLSKTITDPIIQISRQAEDIAAFDFSSRYDGPSADEIGQLGQYMNHISGELQGRIDELKGMNVKLKSDMDHQRRFLASISHEFKSPVGIIKGYAESIKLNYYDGEVEKNRLVDRILESADQMSALVEDMIMLSMLDKREFKLRKSQVDLSELLETACMKMKDRYADGPVRLEWEIEEGIIFMGDRMRLTQVFDNLLQNGFRYAVVPFDFKVSMKDMGQGVVIRFTNTCSPIADEDLGQIFSPFFRFEKSHNKKTGGHGLGLSIVKALVEAHGGRVKARYGKGEFHMEILL